MSGKDTQKSNKDSPNRIAMHKLGASLISDAYFQLRDVSKRLEELNNVKDMFLSFTTHGLRTPLTPIKTQSQLLLSGYYGELSLEQRGAVEMIMRNSDFLNMLSDDVLDIAKMKSSAFKIFSESTDFGKLVMDVFGDTRSIAEQKNLTFSLFPIPEIGNVMIDPLRIKQVLCNILDNSIKFTPEGGTISLEVKNTGEEVVVSVKDSGVGIDKDYIQKLFVPFFQIENSFSSKHRGTGLGLAISKGIVEAHGGKIWVESDGKGSTFIFSLPIIN